MINNRRVVLISFLLFVLGFTATPPVSRAQWPWTKSASGTVTVQVLDIGQGDSILIRSPEGKTALIDAGPSRDGALRALQRAGVQKLDILALSHHHSDHYGGMAEIIREMKPRYFLASTSGHTTKTYLELLKTVESQRVTMVQPSSRARKIELGSVELVIFPQAPEDKKEENNNSVCLRLNYGSFSVLFPGDSETPERRWWLQKEPSLVRDCTILKLAHHGSRNGTDATWLKAVQPELAVASMASGNDYGHPHAETVNLLRRSGIPFLRTDQLGAITIQSDGSNWRVVRPSLAGKGHPSQQDIDRIASTKDGSTERGSRRTLTR